MSLKRGQVGIEYMVIVGFITFAIMAILALAVYYSEETKDRIRLNQVENFAVRIINNAESVFFSGEPSKLTLKPYLPEGVKNIQIIEDSLVFTIKTSSGDNVVSYKSKVPIQGTISSGEGIKKIILEAQDNYLQITG
jgi:hypothetical protein